MADELPQRAYHRLADADDVVLVDEAHLDVELGELRLTVGAEVLVAVAARDLEVALHARHHQQLLEQLRTLRKRIPAAGLKSRRHQEVASTFRRRTREGRSFDLHEVVRVQHIACRAVDRAAQTNCRSGRGASEVEVAVAQARLLPHLDVLVDGERQRRRDAQDLELRDDHLDLTGGQLCVGIALRA